jgi:hypothetical protein
MDLRFVSIAAVVVAAPALAANVQRDPFEGDWEGDCGASVYCELQVRRLTRTVYEVDYVLEERGVEVCRTRGTFSRTGHGRLSGQLGRSLAVEVTRFEPGTVLGLAVSRVSGAPCGLSRNVNGRYRRDMDE